MSLTSHNCRAKPMRGPDTEAKPERASCFFWRRPFHMLAIHVEGPASVVNLFAGEIVSFSFGALPHRTSHILCKFFI